MIGSVPTETEVITLVKDLRSFCLEGGFRLTTLTATGVLLWILYPQRKRPKGEGFGQGDLAFGESTGRPVECRDALLFQVTV
jgi:hypothetical protein